MRKSRSTTESMNGLLRVLRVGSLLAVAWLLSVEVARADGVVADCTESALLDALIGGGLVTFDQDCSITVTAPIEISQTTTIDAQGFSVTISGGGAVRVFNVQPGNGLTLVGITISDGLSTNGGAFYLDTGSSLLLTNCTVSGNQATGTNGVNGTNGADNPGGNAGSGTSGTAGTPAFGGAVYNLGSLTFLSTTVVGNTATGGTGGNGGNGGSGRLNAGNGGNGGAGALARGGAIFNLGAVTLMDCGFISNTVTAGAGGAGGFAGTNGTSGFPGSGAVGGEASGAGIYSTQRVTIARCTFASNVATGGKGAAGGMLSNGNGQTGPSGGASFGAGVFTTGGGAITNCTFFGDVAAGGAGGAGGAGNLNAGNGGNGGSSTGGGLYSTGTVAVVNCTFSTCAAIGGTNGLPGSSGAGGSPGSPGASRGGDLANGAGAFTLMNSIVASNLAGGNGFGTIIDASNNISSDASIALGSGSRKNTDPKIGLLANNGGPTDTVALLAGSPAIDATNIHVFPPTDQRGIARPGGKAPDIGAYEVAPPYIQTQPLSQSQTNGGPVTLFVVAIGDPVLRYQWRFSGSRIVGATDSAYTLPQVASTNTGNYDVTVTNNFGGATSTVAVLTVSVPPMLTLQPSNLTVNAGSTVVLAALAIGDTPLLYQWMLQGTNLPGATKPNLTLSNVQVQNSGNYSVGVTNNAGGAVSTNAVLLVNGPPYIAVPPASQSAELGSPVTFSVTPSGVGPFTYQWRKNQTTDISGAIGAFYSISAAAQADAGTYDVLVGNAFGSTRSSAASLTVTLPFITGKVTFGSSGLGGVQVSAGTNITLTAADGRFAFSNLLAGTYSVAPTLANYLFSPTNALVTVPPSPGPLSFSAFTAFTISGTVFNGTNRLSGVTVTAQTNSAISDASGNYAISVRAGTYEVFASTPRYKFDPVQVTVGPSTNNVNFQVVSTNYTISGHVRYGTNGVANVRINGFQTTDANGFYSLTFPAGTNVLTPVSPGFVFRPASIAVVNPPDATDIDFQTGAFISAITRLGGGAVKLTVTGTNIQVRLQASSDLRTWTSLYTNHPPFQFTDSTAGNFPVRYYRTSQP
jgi:hypothetical protein